MFYADFIFSKKNPLNRVWLAAHFDKRLTKIQVFDANILALIKEILNPEISLSVRLSGHLLFGVIRLYYLQLCYILDETASSYLKQIKAPLDKESRYFEAKLHRKIKRRKISFDLTRQSKIEDITLRDDSLPVLRMSEEETKIPKFEEEVMRSFMGNLEESAYELSKIVSPRISEIKNTSIQNMQIDFNNDTNAPDFELPPERTFVSHLTTSRVNRKRKAILIDNETSIDKATFKHFLDDVGPITKKQNNSIENLPDWNNLLAQPGICVLGKILTKLYQNIPATTIRSPQPCNTIPFEPVYCFEPDQEFVPEYVRVEKSNLQTTIEEEANQTLKELTTFLMVNESTSFNEFTSIDSRETACKKFVSLLQLHKLDIVNLCQKKPYQEITISCSNKSHLGLTF
ncbi:LOW QUALITY PROTEIN: hypothetical protein MXB_1139 [Myxobolus squamalis]|nr:LOW QUALITY PROTEIN: hypothetical protein MXB_1139 [Myxobolus squamalis]